MLVCKPLSFSLVLVLVLALAGIFFLCQPVALATEESELDKGQTSETSPSEQRKQTQREFRGSKTIGLVANYGLYSFLVPGKKGGQLSWIKSESSSWELDYFSGDYGLKKFGVNMISFSERVIIMRYRKYWSGTFNLGIGLGERRYAFELGSRILEKVPSEVARRDALIELTRYVFDLNLGNRWHFNKGLVVGIDWLSVSLPFGPGRRKAAIVDSIEDEEDRNDTNKVLNYLNYLPTISLLKLGLGYAF